MNKSKILTVVLIILFVIIILTIVNSLNNKSGKLISPFSEKTSTAQTVPPPQASSNNLPIEIKYDSATDLGQELENVNPQVLDSDFSE